MKIFPLLIALFVTSFTSLNAQNSESAAVPKSWFGIKGGVNFINVKDAGSINGGNNSGFMAGLFFQSPSKGLLGYRSEIIFSRQGYDFQTSATTGSVKLNYILLPQLTTINITRFVQLQLGGQIGFLLNSGVDSLSSLSTLPAAGPEEYFRRITYGLAGGVELSPLKSLFVGGRFNLNIASVTKETGAGRLPSYIPTDGKQLYNNVVQLYAGFKF
ncbi:MAG TPA: porin family protein [Flavisolibacter sp.]|nr:porin family protein [Flavisolibacter sp.]